MTLADAVDEARNSGDDGQTDTLRVLSKFGSESETWLGSAVRGFRSHESGTQQRAGADTAVGFAPGGCGGTVSP